jgi:hypothetical protein
VVLSVPLELWSLDNDVGESVAIQNRKFADSGAGSWIGFYDWLRSDRGLLLGVRSWLSPSEAALIDATARAHPDVELSTNGELRIWFSSRRDLSEWLSGDQSMGDHRLMVSDTGAYAFTFDLDALSEAEIKNMALATRS